MTTILEHFARLVARMDYETLPEQVVDKAKRVIVDSLGCAVGAHGAEPTRIVRKVATNLSNAPHSTLLTSRLKTSVPMATLVNGAMIRYLDYNDTYMGRDPSHPSGNVATVLAAGEYAARSGKDVISALVCAYEVHLRLADHCGDPSLWLRGWDHATNSTYGAAAASSRLLGLSQQQCAHALGIAGSQANTLGEIRRGEISMIKATAEAKAASDGVMAAMLAEEGFTGPLALMEGDYGHIRVLGASADIDALIDQEPAYKIMKSSLKYYPVETMTQALVEAALHLRRAHRFNPSDIERVVVGLYDFAFKKPAWDKTKLRPHNRETADHSYNYCVAVALLDGEMTDAQFTLERIHAADVGALMEHVDLGVDSALDGMYPASYPGIVTVVMKSGQSFTHRVDHAQGHPLKPGSREDVSAKFRRQCAGKLDDRQIERALGHLWDLDKVEDLRTLLDDFVIREPGPGLAS